MTMINIWTGSFTLTMINIWTRSFTMTIPFVIMALFSLSVFQFHANFRKWILENYWDNFCTELQRPRASQETGGIMNWIIVTLYVCFTTTPELQTVFVQYHRKYYVS